MSRLMKKQRKITARMRWVLLGSGAGLCLLLAILFLFLPALGPKEDPLPSEEPVTLTPTAPPTTTAPTPVPTPTPTPDPYAGLTGLNPLTGLPMDEAYENRRPAAVMLNNDSKKALPMFGINQADILYETLVEGGATRLQGIYQNPSGVPQIGTVRSTRAYYLDIMQGHDAILLHVGYSDEAKDLIRQRGLTTLNLLSGWEDTLYWRDKDRIQNRGLEHSAYTSGERIEAAYQKLKSRIVHETGYQETLRFTADGTPAGGASAQSLSVKYSSYKTGVFAYDAQTKTYAVSQYEEPFIDGQDNTQLRVTNVLVLHASVRSQGDKAGHMTIKLTGEGNGLFACGGRYIPIKWSKKSYDAPFVYTLEDGTPLYLGKGRTYINIVPLSCKLDIE